MKFTEICPMCGDTKNIIQLDENTTECRSCPIVLDDGTLQYRQFKWEEANASLESLKSLQKLNDGMADWLEKEMVRDIVQEFIHADAISLELREKLIWAQSKIKEYISNATDDTKKNEWTVQLGMSTQEGKDALRIAFNYFDKPRI